MLEDPRYSSGRHNPLRRSMALRASTSSPSSAPPGHLLPPGEGGAPGIENSTAFRAFLFGRKALAQRIHDADDIARPFGRGLRLGRTLALPLCRDQTEQALLHGIAGEARIPMPRPLLDQGGNQRDELGVDLLRLD